MAATTALAPAAAPPMDRAAELASWGYDAPPRSAGGKYLRLTAKGDSARIRIVSAPYKFQETFEDKQKGGMKTADRWAWVVIHKELVAGKVERSVKGFKVGRMIYDLIYDLLFNSDWGHPGEYDITVTRTEEKGKYYTVQPHPKPIGPINAEEQALVNEADLDLVAMFAENGESAEMPPAGNPPPEEDPFE